MPGLQTALEAELRLQLPVAEWLKAEPTLSDEDILKRILEAGDAGYAAKVAQVDAGAWHQFERNVMLQSIDSHWREHLAALDYLRQGIHLRGYAQKNPKQEYKRESFELFAELLDKINYDVISSLSKFEVKVEEDIEKMEMGRREFRNKHQIEYT